jgi:hypothetical protein
MDIIITYDAVRTLLANPPSLNPCPNFFNIRKLRSQFARALKEDPVFPITSEQMGRSSYVTRDVHLD